MQVEFLRHVRKNVHARVEIPVTCSKDWSTSHIENVVTVRPRMMVSMA